MRVKSLTRSYCVLPMSASCNRPGTAQAYLAAALVDDARRALPGLIGGEGLLESTFAGYEPVTPGARAGCRYSVAGVLRTRSVRASAAADSCAS